MMYDWDEKYNFYLYILTSSIDCTFTKLSPIEEKKNCQFTINNVLKQNNIQSAAKLSLWLRNVSYSCIALVLRCIKSDLVIVCIYGLTANYVRPIYHVIIIVVTPSIPPSLSLTQFSYICVCVCDEEGDLEPWGTRKENRGYCSELLSLEW